MNLPVEPTLAPHARKHSRKYHAQGSRAFVSNDTITIDIPPIDATYLTKNVKLHFDFDLSYYEGTNTNFNDLFNSILSINKLARTTTGGFEMIDAFSTGIEDISAAFNYFGYNIESNPSSTNFLVTAPANELYAATKPIPTFDINGPYGLISNIKVYDYLGSTLLEEIPAHDILTAQFADFWFKDDNMSIQRPRVTDNQVVRKAPSSHIFQQEDYWNQEPLSKSVKYTWNSGTLFLSVGFKPLSIDVPTVHCCLDLYSFLGKLSEKCIPLHNGFRLVLQVNDISKAVVFNTMYGNNRAVFRRRETIAPDDYFVMQSANNVQLSTLTSVSLYYSTDRTTVYTFTPQDVDLTNQGTWTSAFNKAMNQHGFSAEVYNVNFVDSIKIFAGSSFHMVKNTWNDARFFWFNGTSGSYEWTRMAEYGTVGDPVSKFVDTLSTDLYYAAHGLHTFDSYIDKASISNCYLDAELLTISSDFDKTIDKLVFTKSYKYQKNFIPEQKSLIPRTPFYQTILQNLKSITKVFVGQRLVITASDKGYQRLGYRVKNYASEGSLLYNKAEIKVIKDDFEAYKSLQSCMDEQNIDDYLNIFDFNLDSPTTLGPMGSGTDGQQFTDICNPEYYAYLEKLASVPSNAESSWFCSFKSVTGTVLKQYFTDPLQVITYDPLGLYYQGRFIYAYDCRLPGVTEGTVAGIDSSKAVLEYVIKSEEQVCNQVDVDVFVEHDALIHIDPKKTTTVTF